MLLNDLKADRRLKCNIVKSILFLILLFLLDYSINVMLINGLNRYYGLNSQSEIALIGHSHLMLGVDKVQLEKGINKNVAKFTREGVNVADRSIMIDQLIVQNQYLNTVIYGVDAWMFTGEGLSENSYKLFYPFMGQTEVRNYIKEQASFADYYQHLLIKSSRYNESLISGSFRGYLKNWSNLKFGTVDTVKLRNDIVSGKVRRINSNEENREIFEKSLEKLTKHGIKVILLYIPTINIYNNIEEQKFKHEIEYFHDVVKQYPGIEYVEFLEPFSSDYSLFFDPIHLNPQGQNLITQKVIEYLTNKRVD